MEKQILESLVRWAVAYREASGNSQLIVDSGFNQTVMELCSEKMKAFESADQALFALQGRKDLPSEVEVYMEATDDSACTACLYSSAGLMHSECRRKMDHYFRSRENLYAYASSFVGV